jgi:hypothetical protein
VTGVPLVYVIGVVLIPEDKKDDPPFGEEDTKYTSVDMETTAHAHIISADAEFEEEFKTLKAYGPFVPTFLTDTKKVWSILLACFGLLSTATRQEVCCPTEWAAGLAYPPQSFLWGG